MILLLDNYDSFAHNLARYLVRLGQSVRVVRSDAIDVSAIRALHPAAIVISPGPCTPNEAGASLEIVRTLHAELPMLGVCLGHQVIVAALGGRIERAPQPIHGQASPISHTATGLFVGLPTPLRVGRYHSLVASPTSLPAELKAVAYTDDGVIMAIEHVRYPLYGVQFHPESILTEHGYELLANFLRLAGIRLSISPLELGASELRQSAPRGLPLPTRPITF